jgi:hypothetical protein
MVLAMSSSPEVDGRYLLRDLVWCQLCGVCMKPALLSTRIRFYGCTNPACPRPLIEADLVETLVWQAFLYLFAAPDTEMTTAEQRPVLEHVLERVTVGAGTRGSSNGFPAGASCRGRATRGPRVYHANRYEGMKDDDYLPCPQCP